MTMTILTGWPDDEPILELPVDDWDYEAARAGQGDDEGDPLAELVEGPVLGTGDVERVGAILRCSGLAGVLGALLGA